MSYFLAGLPLWLLIALIVALPTILAMAAQVLIHRWVGVTGLAKNNEIAGFKFATVGVIYAVLLAFTVIVVWEKFNDAQSAVANEAGATAALFHYSEGKEPEALAVRTALVNYLNAAIEDEWPAMARETESPRDRARSQFAVQRSNRPQLQRSEGHGGHDGSLSATRQCRRRRGG